MLQRMGQLPNAAAACRRDIVAVQEGLDAASASRLMRDKGVSCLVVTDPSAPSLHGVVGLLTDHDIVSAVVAHEADPKTLQVGDLMTRPALFVAADASLESVAEMMRDAGVRRAPVLDSKGELLGMLRLEDVLECIIGRSRSMSQ